MISNLFTIVILSFSVLFFSCTSTPNETAIGYLWSDTPKPSSGSIMVVSELKGENLRRELIDDLNALGFFVDYADDEQIITEPRPVEDNIMRLLLNIDESTVIISGEKRAGPGEGDWEIVKRGEDEFRSPEWQLMTALSTSLENIEILYD